MFVTMQGSKIINSSSISYNKCKSLSFVPSHESHQVGVVCVTCHIFLIIHENIKSNYSPKF